MSHPRRLSIHFVASSLAIVSIGLGASGCNSREKAATGTEPSASTSARRVETFGAKLGDSPQVTLAEVLESPAKYVGKTVRLDGHVRRACSAKGCWMELAPNSEPNAPGCRVTFKDYGFFVPTDSAGATARIEGEVALKRVRPGQVRHYEGEGATFASKHEDGSADEVRLVATGVELRR